MIITIKPKVIQPFKGEINGVTFDKEWMYNTAVFLLEEAQELKIDMSVETVKELKALLHYFWLTFDEFNLDEFENDVVFFLNDNREFFSAIYSSGSTDYYYDLNQTLVDARNSRFKD